MAWDHFEWEVLGPGWADCRLVFQARWVWAGSQGAQAEGLCHGPRTWLTENTQAETRIERQPRWIPWCWGLRGHRQASSWQGCGWGVGEKGRVSALFSRTPPKAAERFQASMLIAEVARQLTLRPADFCAHLGPRFQQLQRWSQETVGLRFPPQWVSCLPGPGPQGVSQTLTHPALHSRGPRHPPGWEVAHTGSGRGQDGVV